MKWNTQTTHPGIGPHRHSPRRPGPRRLWWRDAHAAPTCPVMGLLLVSFPSKFINSTPFLFTQDFFCNLYFEKHLM